MSPTQTDCTGETHPSGGYVRLLCFAHAGGSAAEYLSWQAGLPAYIKVSGMELPGRGIRIREPPILEMCALIEHLARDARQLPNAPIALFGHSLGALVAFEFARALRRLGKPPIVLFASGRPAPRLQYLKKSLFDLPDKELLSELRRMNGTPVELLQDADFLGVYLPWIRMDLALNHKYRYYEEPALPCPILGLQGREDELTPPGSMEAWRSETNSSFALTSLPGGHFFTRTSRDQVLRAICEGLGECLRAMEDCL